MVENSFNFLKEHNKEHALYVFLIEWYDIVKLTNFLLKV